MTENKKRIAYKPVLDFDGGLTADHILNIDDDMRAEGVPVAYVDDDIEKKFKDADTICLNPRPVREQLEAAFGQNVDDMDFEASELDAYYELVDDCETDDVVEENLIVLEQKAIAAGFEIVERDLEAEYEAKEATKKAQGGSVVNGK